MSVKNICYNVPPIHTDEDLKKIIATEGVYTSDLYDSCGNLRVFLGCKKDDCSINAPTDCCENPTTIYGSLEVTRGVNGQDTGCGDGDIKANNIIATSFIGDGSEIQNTDNTSVISFIYNEDENDLILEQENPNNPGIVEKFIVPCEPFTKDTKLTYFGYDRHNSNILVTKNSDGVVFKADLSKYDDKHDETYIESGSCDKFGDLKLEYNKPEMSPIHIDISESINNLDKYVTEGYMVNNTLILKRKNAEPIKINMYELIAGLKCPPDTYVSNAFWNGDNLILKRTDGYEIVISFEELIKELIDEINGVIGGCVTSENEIYLEYLDGHKVYIGKTTDNDTFLTDIIWKTNPLFPEDPNKVILRFKQSNDTYIDINFTPILDKLNWCDTKLVKGEIVKDRSKTSGTSYILLKNSDDSIVKIDGLINSDTKNKYGYYDPINKSLVIADTNEQIISIPLDILMREMLSKTDKYLSEVNWVGETLIFKVEGGDEIPVSFKTFKDVALSLKNSIYDPITGILKLKDNHGDFVNIDGFVKNSDIENFITSNDINYMEEILTPIPLDDGRTLIKYRKSGDSSLSSIHIPNIYVNHFDLYGNTLRLRNTDGSEYIANLSSITKIAEDNSKITNAYLNSNSTSLTLQTKNDLLTINGFTPKPILDNTSIPVNGWDGEIKYTIYGNSLQLTFNLENGNGINPMLVELPFELPFDVDKIVYGKTNGNYIPTKINITKEGIVTLPEAIPTELKDTFTIIIN